MTGPISGPMNGTVSTLAATLVGQAILAPSSHNTQPWVFRVHDGGGGRATIELSADRSRALPVNDPHDRELTISCAAALLNLRVAAAARGVSAATELAPDPGDPDLLARVRVSPPGGEPSRSDRALSDRALTDQALSDRALGEAVGRRHTSRDRFTERPTEPATVAGIVAAAAAEGASLTVLDPAGRDRLAGLVAEADRVQFADPRWRRELARWMHSGRDDDGLAVPVAAASRLVVSAMDMGPRVGRQDAELIRTAPLVGVLWTRGDDLLDWLAAGQALERVLLVLAAAGAAAGYANQPCQVGDPHRASLAGLLPAGAVPQVVLRAGFPTGDPPAHRRRPVAEVLRT